MGKRRRNYKATNVKVTQGLLNSRINFLKANDWPKSKWIFFCEEMLRLGFTVELYEARQTKSKYCTVKRPATGKKPFKVRFSDHKPIYHREAAGDCDFFVGVTHTGVRNTQHAINAVCAHFEIDRNNPFSEEDRIRGMEADFMIIDDPLIRTDEKPPWED